MHYYYMISSHCYAFKLCSKLIMKFTHYVMATMQELLMDLTAIWGLLDKDDDLKASHKFLHTERIFEDNPNRC